jgi:homoserine kinase
MRPVLTVRAPATSANLGPGFDCLSLALDVANVVRAWPSDRVSVDVVGEGAGELPTDATNEVYRAVGAVFAARAMQPPPLRLRCENVIPPTRGLGSSSAARASGLLVGNALLDEPLSLDELLDIGAEQEGHPDNIAACLLGGVQVCVTADGRVAHCRVPVAHPLRAVVFVPDFPMDTKRARSLLPRQVPVETAVYNMSRAAMLVAALATGQTDLLRTATEDAIHQSPRAQVFPALPGLLAAALDAGAYGAFLSGAGSSVLALADAERAESIGNAFATLAAVERIRGRVLHARISEHGATVERTAASVDLGAIWPRIASLRGQVMQTVTGRPFTIDHVSATSVHVTPRTTGRQRPIARANLEQAFELWSTRGPLRPSDLLALNPDEQNSAYIAVIVNRVFTELGRGVHSG